MAMRMAPGGFGRKENEDEWSLSLLCLDGEETLEVFSFEE